MKTLILHPGAPKTGTTSIQQTLGWNLRDSRFRLISQDDRWGNLTAATLFGMESGQDVLDHSFRSTAALERFRNRCRQKLDSRLQQALAREVTPVYSGEIFFRLSASELRRAKEFFEKRGFSCRVVIYVRPTLDVLESGIQQYVKARLTSCLLYTSPSPRDVEESRMPSSA